MQDRRHSWTPPGQPERHDPLPSFLRLPARGWSRLTPRGRRIAAAAAIVAVAAIAVAWPYVERDKDAGAERRAAEAAERRAARISALREDQRPRRAALPAQARRRIAAAGGLRSEAAAGLAGERLAEAIAADVRSRIATGKLEGPLLETTCDPVEVRSARSAGYNCFALTGQRRSGERVIESGYRFSARAELPAKLVWCKENPRPLHPTSYVISLPISPECR
jgi:hypothetical protein